MAVNCQGRPVISWSSKPHQISEEGNKSTVPMHSLINRFFTKRKETVHSEGHARTNPQLDSPPLLRILSYRSFNGSHLRLEFEKQAQRSICDKKFKKVQIYIFRFLNEKYFLEENLKMQNRIQCSRPICPPFQNKLFLKIFRRLHFNTYNQRAINRHSAQSMGREFFKKFKFLYFCFLDKNISGRQFQDVEWNIGSRPICPDLPKQALLTFSYFAQRISYQNEKVPSDAIPAAITKTRNLRKGGDMGSTVVPSAS